MGEFSFLGELSLYMPFLSNIIYIEKQKRRFIEWMAVNLVT